MPKKRADEHSEPSDESLFAKLKDDDPAVIATVNQARESLAQFRAAFTNREFSPANYLVKLPFVDRSDTGEAAIVRTPEVAVEYPTQPIAHLFLRVYDVLEELFFVSVIESPAALQLAVNDCFVIDDEVVEDWMIYHQGIAYGGFSMRLMRTRLNEKAQERFDEHTGIIEFKQLPS